MRPGLQQMTLPVADFLQRWLLHVPVPQTRTVRCYGLYHATQTAALALCRAALGQPPVVVPVGLDWQTVCAQRGEAHPERCPTCGQLLVCTGVIPRGRSTSPPGIREVRRMRSRITGEPCQGRGVPGGSQGTRTTACEQCSGAAQGRHARPSLLPVWGRQRLSPAA